MWQFLAKPLLIAVSLLMVITISSGAHTNILAGLGSHMDVSCSDEKCDRNVNEQLVQIIQSFMNTDVSPCDDFYKYACGNWTETSEHSSLFQKQEEDFSEIYVKLFDKWLKKIKAGQGEELKLNAAYEKALNFYNSCNKEHFFQLNEIPMNLEPAPQQKWPIFSNRSSLPWNFENFVWWKVLAKLQSYDLTNVLLSVTVDTEMRKRSNYAIAISHHYPSKKFSDISRRITSQMGKYTEVQEKLLRWKLLDFEKQLVNAIEGEEENVEEEKEKEEEKEHDESKQSHEEDSKADKSKGSDESGEETKKDNSVETDKNSNENASKENGKENSEDEEPEKYLTLSELQSELPGIDWKEYFRILLQDDNIALPDDKIFKILESEKASLLRLIEFLNKSSKETVALFQLAYFMEYVERPWPLTSEKKFCVSSLLSVMPLTMDHIYEDYFYGSIREQSDAVIRRVFNRLKLKLNDLVEANSIDLTEQEIEYLHHKSDKMRLVIGNLPDNKTKEFLLEYYAVVNITNTTSFYHNYLELLHHKQLLQYRILNAYNTDKKNVYETFDPVMGFDASSSPYHLRTRNLIVLPYSYLQMPLYHHKLHDVFQYAELGFTTGHEIMHGFDESGLWFDADGNYNDIGKGISDKPGFRKKLECLSRVKTASIDERIADVAGIRLVMEAFFNDRTSKARKFHTHSTDLTNRQLFFIKLSQYFCQESSDDDDSTDLSELSHDLSNVRVVYTMSNTREFAREFQCEENTALKLDEVCQLW